MRTWWTWRQTSTVIYFDPCSFRGLGTQVCQHCGRCIPQIGTFMPICPLCHSKGWGGPTKSFQILFFVFFLVFSMFLGFLAKNAKFFVKTKKTIFQRSWGWGGPTKSFQIYFFCCFFFGFLNVFWFLSMGSSPKRLKVFFMLSLHGGLYWFFLFMVLSGGQTTWRADKLKGC